MDTKTSGGDDNYNAMQLSLARRFNSGLTLNSQYTLSRSYGTTAGSNEALTAANNAVTLADYEYERGYNRFDVRHTYNVSALYSLPVGKGRKWLSTPAASSRPARRVGRWHHPQRTQRRAARRPGDRNDVVVSRRLGNVVGSPVRHLHGRHQHAWRRCLARRAPGRTWCLAWIRT